MVHRTNIATVVKTFRFSPELVEDMERVLALSAGEDDKPKYKYMTVLVTEAIHELVKKERRVLEDQGVAWDHLGSDIKQLTQEESNQ